MTFVKICVFLLLFLSQTWAEEGEHAMIDTKLEEAKGTIIDLWKKLQELRELVIEQKTELSNSKSRIARLEGEKIGDA